MILVINYSCNLLVSQALINFFSNYRMAITQDVNSEQKIIQIAIDQHNVTVTTSVAVKHLSMITWSELTIYTWVYTWCVLSCRTSHRKPNVRECLSKFSEINWVASHTYYNVHYPPYEHQKIWWKRLFHSKLWNNGSIFNFLIRGEW